MRRVENPPNPWHSAHVEYLERPPPVDLEIYEERAKSILSENTSPDVPFRWSVNPYRGCFHACAYCYARPTHEYLDWGAGTDFERRIVVKANAAELLGKALRKRTWRGELVAFSGVTDCYQPLEASYALTQACLEECLRARNPVSIITKGALVERDAELLAELEQRAGASVFVSIPFTDEGMARRIEPFAATPERRFQALARLSDAGVPTGVAIAPVIPGLNDDQIPEILRRARAAGARQAFTIMLRLPGSVAAVFEARLRATEPLRADKVFNTLAETRGGTSGARGFGERMRGAGPRWEAVDNLFKLHCRRLGFAIRERDDEAPPPPAPRQQDLFGR